MKLLGEIAGIRKVFSGTGFSRYFSSVPVFVEKLNPDVRGMPLIAVSRELKNSRLFRFSGDFLFWDWIVHNFSGRSSDARKCFMSKMISWRIFRVVLLCVQYKPL